MQINDIKEMVVQEFQVMDEFILQSLRSGTTLVNEIGRHLIQSGGKRLRPLVLLILAKACGYQGKQDIELAAVIEFIHTVTLLHDDVVDEAHLRRGKKTANALWGNEAAILVGDFIHSRAYQIIVKFQNHQIIQILADATNVIAEGEVLQLMERNNPEMSEGAYLTIIRGKTAKLFEVASLLGALLANASSNIQEAATLYGMHLGTAYQLIDDMLDYASTASITGKDNGNDLAEGKLTLPVIHAIQNGKPHDVRILKRAIKEGRAEDFEEVKKIIERTGSIDYTVNFAKVEAKRAQDALAVLPESSFKEAAKAIAQFTVERTS